MMRENSYRMHEIRDIAVADAVLIFAFSLTLIGGAFGFSEGAAVSDFISLLPIVALAVTLSFVLHELMHKFTAQRYGAIAAFKTSYSGLFITMITGLFGFLIGIPGATVIYTSSFTRRQNGIVSIAGPLTNFAVFFVFLAIGLIYGSSLGTYLQAAVSLTLTISILLAFFNMLPIFPLDGSKVLAWNKPVYFATLAAIFVLMMEFTLFQWYDVVFMLLIALMFSFFYRHI